MDCAKKAMALRKLFEYYGRMKFDVVDYRLIPMPRKGIRYASHLHRNIIQKTFKCDTKEKQSLLPFEKQMFDKSCLGYRREDRRGNGTKCCRCGSEKSLNSY